jgi:hypothetical protein
VTLPEQENEPSEELNNFLDADRQEGMDLLVGYTTFSNADDIIEPDFEGGPEGNSATSDDMAFISIKQAARENIFGKLIGRLEDQEKAKLEEQFGVVNGGDDEEEEESTEGSQQQGVDLRWLPGDLQSHMISNADLLLEEGPSSHGKAIPFEFSSSKALASIDRRSASDSPWWAEFADDDDSSLGSSDMDDFDDGNEDEVASIDDDFSDNEEEDMGITTTLPEYQRFPRLERSQVLGILVIGLRAPIRMASAVVTLLGLIFLPAIIQHDFNRR